jgi:hypothetical protein
VCTPESYKKFPNFAFEIDGEFYILHKDNFIVQTGDYCKLNLYTDPNMPFWILGLNFLKEYYTIFDQGNQRMAMVLAKK